MPTFAVKYTYSSDTDLIAQVRPTHREWLASKLAEGSLLASGPMVDTPTALLIWRFDSVKALAELLDQDPFDIAGCISERIIEEWNPVFGPWS